MKNFKVGLMIGLLFIGQGLIASDRSVASNINESVKNYVIPGANACCLGGFYASAGAMAGAALTVVPAVVVGGFSGNSELMHGIIKTGGILGASTTLCEYVQSQDTSEEVKAGLHGLIAQAGCTGLGMVAGFDAQASAGGCLVLIGALTAAAALQN